MQQLRKDIEISKAEALATLDEILLEQFTSLRIKYEEAQLTGKPKKRVLNLADIKKLEPFHWGYEFDEIINQRGGFDAIITNPPWEIFKPQAKEFFAEYSDLVTKNKMDIKQFEKEQAILLQEPEIAQTWITYQRGMSRRLCQCRNLTLVTSHQTQSQTDSRLLSNLGSASSISLIGSESPSK